MLVLSLALVTFSTLDAVESRPAMVLRDVGSLDHSATRGRTEYDIIRSCILTVFACVWTAVHPNIAGPQEAGWVAFWRRIITSSYAIIAPEAVVMWALRQNIAAERIAHQHNQKWFDQTVPPKSWWTLVKSFHHYIKESGKTWLVGPDEDQISQSWTKTHGLFIQMGGYMLYNNRKPVRVLDLKDYNHLRSHEWIDAPLVSEREIQDRTKSDTISKALVVLQTTWFVLQCVARWHVGLSLTELEVITLGFAVLNAVVYAVWWNKPQGVEVAIAIHLKPPSGPDYGGQLGVPLPDPKKCPECRAKKVGTSSFEELSHSEILEKTASANIFFRWSLVPFQPLIDMLSCHKIPPNADCVPDYYAAAKGTENRVACMIACIVGILFGALHALAWTSSFPTQFERILWRISTLIIIAEPINMLIVGVLTDDKDDKTAHAAPPHKNPMSFKQALRTTFVILVILGAPLYFFARFALIISAFSSLRALPGDALKVVSWTSFIPHL